MHETPDSLLARLLPVALARAEGMEGGLSMDSPLSVAAGPWLTLANADGVHVYEQAGGWAADVSFSGVPAGLSNAVGSLDAEPLPTREAAIDHAIGLLSLLALRKVVDVPPPPRVAPFLYRGHNVAVPTDLIRALEERFGPADATAARVRLRALDEYLGVGRKPTDLDGLGKEGETKVLTAAAAALTAGVLRWPDLVPEAADVAVGTGPTSACP